MRGCSGRQVSTLSYSQQSIGSITGDTKRLDNGSYVT